MWERKERFMKPMRTDEKKQDNLMARKDLRRIGSLEGCDLVDMDYDIDECNSEVAEMFGVYD